MSNCVTCGQGPLAREEYTHCPLCEPGISRAEYRRRYRLGFPSMEIPREEPRTDVYRPTISEALDLGMEEPGYDYD